MTNTFRTQSLTSLLTVSIVLTIAPAARAQHLMLGPTVAETTAEGPGSPAPSTTSPRPSLLEPFTEIPGDIRHLPTRENLAWLVVGMGAAMGAHAADTRISRDWTEPTSQALRPGAIVGGTPFELGTAFATYAIGRATNSPRAMNLGGDLIRAQILAELITTGVKQAVRRARPEGTGYSFPSGHTTVTFASATVLQRHFGWKVGIPAYAVASYVAASRVGMKRHYLSDVTLGAALGVIAGRTVTVGRGRQWILTPTVTDGGGGVALAFIGKQ